VNERSILRRRPSSHKATPREPGRGASPNFGVSESDTEADFWQSDEGARSGRSTRRERFRDTRKPPNLRQREPDRPRLPPPPKKPPHFCRRLAQDRVMSKSAPSERSPASGRRETGGIGYNATWAKAKAPPIIHGRSGAGEVGGGRASIRPWTSVDSEAVSEKEKGGFIMIQDVTSFWVPVMSFWVPDVILGALFVERIIYKIFFIKFIVLKNFII